MLRECIYGECAHEQHVRRTLTLTHTITAYSVSGNVELREGNVVRVRILICATRQKPCRKRVYLTPTPSPLRRFALCSVLRFSVVKSPMCQYLFPYCGPWYTL